MNKKTLDNLNNIENKTVILRVDFNVPINKLGKITDNNRVVMALPTIKELLNKNVKLILLSHLGRIKSEADKKTKSLKVVASELSKQLDKTVKFVSANRGPLVDQAVKELEIGNILMLENTRFEDVIDGEVVNYESKNNLELAKYWANLGDIFVNDAFGTAHRSHASNVGIAENIKVSAVGRLIELELRMLSKAVNNPKRPLVSIIGGAKVSDKINVIKNLLQISDYVLIGGGMSYTFLKSQGKEVGDSLVENDKLELASEILKTSNNKLILPLDIACVKEFADIKPTYRLVDEIPSTEMGLDIGPKTVSKYKGIIENAHTVVWNGPMGVFEFKNFAHGTKAICSTIANIGKENIFSIIGGGDSASAAINLGYHDKFSHISTGGGASLAFLEGKKLPAIEAIENN